MWVWIICALVVAVGFVAFTGAPYVPSKRRDVETAFTNLYHVSDSDVVVDIGSGDGIVLRVASRLGARAIGYEIHPVLVMISRWLSRHDAHVSVRLSNFWTAALPDDTTVVYTFGDARDISKMYAKVQAEATRMGRSLRFITYGFDVPGVEPANSVGAHHLYTVASLQGSGETV